MTFLSKEKLKELVLELEELKENGRQKIAQRLDEAKAFGDLSENAEYHQAREDQGKMESRIRDLEYMTKNAEIVKKHHSEIVEVGTSVVITKKNTSKKEEFEITGEEDSDVLKGKIGFNSPLASSMLGKKEGEDFDFQKPDGEIVSYKIISIK